MADGVLERGPNVTTTSGQGFVLSPDPTTLTNELVDKAREDIRREIDFVRQILSQRLDAMDIATKLLQEWRETLPGRLREAINAQINVTDERFRRVDERFNVIIEKFGTIAIQFEERDTRSRGDATATKTAVDAAFAAQRDMVAAQNSNIAQALARIEATSQKQIEQLVTLLQTTVAASNDKFDDMKQRVSLIEGRTAGITAAGTTQREAVVTQQGSSNYNLAILAFVFSALLGVVSIIIAVMKG